MTDWTDEYAATDDLNKKYSLLRAEISRLRGRRDDIEFFNSDAIRCDLRRLNETVEGDLIVFVANDFGRPRAYRPQGVDKRVQNDVREALLQDKYDDTNAELNALRRELLAAHPTMHKAIVSEHTGETLRYHLPEGSNESTNFVTVREMVGLIDYTTNSFQSDGLCETY